MKKVFLLVVSILVEHCLLCADNIHLVQHDPPIIDPEDEPRSFVNQVFATIEANVLVVSFSDLSSSQIVVTDSSDYMVYNQNYASSYSVRANLSLLPEGDYTLFIYAFDCWWYGYFEIE